MKLQNIATSVLISLLLLSNLHAASLSELINQNKIPKAKLGFLNLSNMGIDDLRGLQRLNLDGVHTLILRRNKIREIPPNIFNVPNTLRALDLAYNEITSIDPNGFKGLNRLWVLLLTGNAIEKLPALKGVPRLKFVDVYGNQISNDNIDVLQKRMPKARVYNFPITKRFLQVAGLGIVGLGAFILGVVSVARARKKEEDVAGPGVVAEPSIDEPSIVEDPMALKEAIDKATKPEDVVCDVWHVFNQHYKPGGDNSEIISALEHFYRQFGISPFAVSNERIVVDEELQVQLRRARERLGDLMARRKKLFDFLQEDALEGKLRTARNNLKELKQAYSDLQDLQQRGISQAEIDDLLKNEQAKTTQLVDRMIELNNELAKCRAK